LKERKNVKIVMGDEDDNNDDINNGDGCENYENDGLETLLEMSVLQPTNQQANETELDNDPYWKTISASRKIQNWIFYPG